ncbi:MAG TPA: STAS domain-containing protein [Trebonia sp.]|jgi:ABC-type transporter Mla MlaB component|nr:STAS domain-containing protein [Trebonia sp.]
MALVHVSIREGDGQVVVVLRGVLDVVDLAGLAFMDSSGVAALVHGRKQARSAGDELLLAAPRPPVQRVLALTRLLDVFRVCASVDEAARSVSRPPRVAVPSHRGCS